MASKKESRAEILLPVKPYMPDSSVRDLLKKIKDIEKKAAPLERQFTHIAKNAKINLKQIDDIATVTGEFSKKLSRATQNSVKDLVKLGDELQEAKDQAEQLQKSYKASTSEAAKNDVSTQLKASAARISSANRAIDDFRKNNIKAAREIKNYGMAHDRSKKKLEESANYDAGTNFKEGIKKLFQGNLKGGAQQLGETAHKSLEKKSAQMTQDAAVAGEGSSAARAAQAMSGAMTAFAAAGIVIAGFIKLLMAASDHMTSLNKALLSGNGLANEWGASSKQFTKSVDDMRGAAIGASIPLLRFGSNSEEAMKTAGAFAKEATGSIVQTEIALRGMGGGNLQKGMTEFTKNATIYGKALGMETTEVGSLMGKMVGEIGISSENVQKTMGDIVKQAAQSGMPVSKFMNIFHDTIPDLDLFTNRIEELTGVMKLLSKNMDSRAIKGFVGAMGKGFDQVDFKSRLKTFFQVGQGEMTKIMGEDAHRATNAVAAQLKKSGLADEFKKAMGGPDAEKAVAALAAKAQALGVQGSTIAEMGKAARYKTLGASKDPLKQTTGMRDMGMMARYETLEKLSQRYGKGFAGLQEHVIKQSGISEQEYKALVDMSMSLGNYTSSAAKIGRTSSKSINDSLKETFSKELAADKSGADDETKFENLMKDMAKNKPEELKKAILAASATQVESAEIGAKEDDKKAATMEDLTVASVAATQSLGDQIENILKVILEKIYFVLNDILKGIGSLYDMLPSWLNGDVKGISTKLGKWSADAKNTLGPNNKKGQDYYQKTNKSIIESRAAGMDNDQMYKEFETLFYQSFNKDADKDEMVKKLSSVMGGDKANEVASVAKLGTADGMEFTEKSIKGLSRDKMSELLSVLAHDKAKKMEGQDQKEDLGYKNKKTGLNVQTKKQLEVARAQGDIDKRATDAYLASGTGTAVGQAAVQQGSSSSPASEAAKIAEQTSDSTAELAKTQEESAKKTEKIQQDTSSVAEVIKKGVKLDSTWTNQEFKSAIGEATLASFRTALAEYLVAYLRADNDAELKKSYSEAGAEGLSLQSLVQQKNAEEMKRAIAESPHAAAGAGPVWADLRRESIVPNNELRAATKPSGGVHVGQITVNVDQGDPNAIKNAVYNALSEVARRH